MEVDLLKLEGRVAVFLGVGLLVIRSVEKREREVCLVLGHLHHGGIGDGKAGVSFVLCVVVHHHAMHHAVVVVSAVHSEDVAVDTVVKGSSRNLDLILGLADILSKLVDVVVGYRDESVADEESTDTDAQTDDSKRDEDSLQGDSGCLDGKELVILSELSESHHGCEESRQRQGEREHCRASPCQELQDHPYAQSFADELVDVEPQELHDEDEHDDKQDRYERSHE